MPWESINGIPVFFYGSESEIVDTALRETLNSLPESEVIFLNQGNLIYNASEKLRDLRPDLVDPTSTEFGRYAPSFGDWNNNIYIPQGETFPGASNILMPPRNSDYRSVILHETGHALDDTFGPMFGGPRMSDSFNFELAYHADVARLDPALLPRIKNYLGEQGRQQLSADLYVIEHGGQPVASNLTADELRAAFGFSAGFVHNFYANILESIPRDELTPKPFFDTPFESPIIPFPGASGSGSGGGGSGGDGSGGGGSGGDSGGGGGDSGGGGGGGGSGGSSGGGGGGGGGSSYSGIDGANDNLASAQNASTRVYDPLLLDLNGDGIRTTNLAGGIRFDHEASGFEEQTAWVSNEDGFLVLDRNSDGFINDGGELFGESTILANGQRAAKGFDGLRALDANHDGKIDASDPVFSQLKVLRGDGSLLSLEEAGVKELGLSYSTSSTADANGNIRAQVGSYTRTDGSTVSVRFYPSLKWRQRGDLIGAVGQRFTAGRARHFARILSRKSPGERSARGGNCSATVLRRAPVLGVSKAPE